MTDSPPDAPATTRAYRLLPPWLRLLRPQQWIKNAFVVAPLFFTPQALNAHALMMVALGVGCFCALASAVYVLNDYMDRDADRLHPTKRLRPLASGAVSPGLALFLMALLGLGGLGAALALSKTFGAIAALYLAVNLGYCLGLKQASIIDVMLVAFGYILRVFAGSELIGVQPSVWIIVATGLVALFIALAKRRDDLSKDLDVSHRKSLSGYTKPFIDAAVSMVLAGLLVSYLIYTTEADVMQRLGTTKLYFTTPFVVMGVLRYLQVALVEERSGSPTTIVLTDKFLIGCVVAWLVVFGALIYA